MEELVIIVVYVSVDGGPEEVPIWNAYAGTDEDPIETWAEVTPDIFRPFDALLRSTVTLKDHWVSRIGDFEANVASLMAYILGGLVAFGSDLGEIIHNAA